MQMATEPKLSRDLQWHLGRELGQMVGRTVKEPLPQAMTRLLDSLREREEGQPAPDPRPTRFGRS